MPGPRAATQRSRDFAVPLLGEWSAAPKTCNYLEISAKLDQTRPANEWLVMKSRALAGMAPDRRTTGAQPGEWRSFLAHSFFRYGLAVLSVAVALGIKLALQKFNVGYPLSSSFLAAIAI